MTVAELIESLKALPQDMEVMMMDPDRESPVEIIQVSRGSWSDDLDEDIEPDYESLVDPEFVQDDENGKIVVLVTW